MTKMIFINLPVADLPAAIAFYARIGATLNPTFSDDTAACMILSDTINVMLLTHAKFSQFTTKPIADAKASCAVLLCINAESRLEVDATIDKAGAAGGRADCSPAQDHGFMYGRSFEDLDGHSWEVMWMDPTAASA